jgi:hypothetical protein
VPHAGTNQAGVNNLGKPYRFCFVLIDSNDGPVWKRGRKPK